MTIDRDKPASAPTVQAPAPASSRSKRRPRLVQATKNRSGEAVGVDILEGVSRRPKHKRVTRVPNLTEPGVDWPGDGHRVQNFRKRARIDDDVKPADDKHGDLRVRSGGAVWVDGPTLHTLMFGK